MSSDLWTEITDRMALLEIALKEIGSRGREFADSERAYKTALAAEMLRLRADGMPVTITPDIARGKDEIANLRFARDCSEALYKAALEAVNIYKLEIKLLESQLEREWHK